MSNRAGDFDHLWKFNESSGQMVDTIGSKNSTTISGAPTYNGGSDGVSFDSVDDDAQWDEDNAPFVWTDDFTHWFQFKLTGSINGVARFFHVPDVAGKSMYLYWDDLNVTNKFRFSDGIATTITIDANREPDPTEKVSFGFSWVNATKTIKWVLKSDAESSPFDLSGTQVLTLVPAASGQKINSNQGGTVFTGLTGHNMATIDGEAASIVDIQDTIDAGFVADVVGGGRYSRRDLITKIY